MFRYKLTLEYEGTRYRGWQAQKEARTIQGELFKAIETGLGISDYDVQGAGRTDAGVHALSQVAHLDIPLSLEAAKIRYKLNNHLPHDINILRAEKADPRFHARHDALSRSYLYQIATRRTAFGKPFVWWIRDELDTEAMRYALKLFEGMHDFRSFAAKEAETESKKVRLYATELIAFPHLIILRFHGSHFLWKMIRQITGTIAEIGRGKLKPDSIRRWLTAYSDEPSRLTAPPSGLFLEGVYYQTGTPLPQIRPLMNF